MILTLLLSACFNSNPYAGETGAQPIEDLMEASAEWACSCQYEIVGQMFQFCENGCVECLLSYYESMNPYTGSCVSAALAEECVDALGQECSEITDVTLAECNPWPNMVDCP